MEATFDENLKSVFYEWIKDKAHIEIDLNLSSYIGFMDGDKIVGAVFFTDYNGHNIFIHMALDNPRVCQRRFIKNVFNYVFNQAGCQRATVTCDNNYGKINKLAAGLGFVKEGVMKNMLRVKNKYVDAAIYGMYKENCKWVS